MEISIAGIEEAVAGLGYRESSPKARLIRTIQLLYENGDSPENMHAIEGDELIDRMWDLGGDRKSIRSRRKNLSSIKSSINQDLDNAWEAGRNPEGITIGPLNTFVMSDAAKDRILNSFSGSMNPEGGNSLDRVAEALKIVSVFLSKTSSDVDGEQLSNLKALIEGFSDKFREGGGELKIVDEKTDGRGAETENGGSEAVTGDRAEDGERGTGDKDTDALEIVDDDEIDWEDSDGLIELEEEGCRDIEEIDDWGEGEADDTVPDEDIPGEDVGLPIDQLMEQAQNFEAFQLEEKQKRLLAEQFDGYLGAMERYYNQYIVIKKGSYLVGADRAEEDVLPKQQILMADYYMGKYPVTNALFEVFVERTGYKTTAEKLGYGYVYHGRFRKVVDQNTGLTSSIWNSTYTREKITGATWYQPLGPGSTLHKKRNHPVVQVSIRDARTFAAWTGKRLPSEIEWEAAARTRDGFRFPWGDEWIEGFCNFESSGISDTCPVDHFPHSANETGLADVLGNVMEWTSDECDAKYPQETPGRFFIAKGGSWISPEQTTLYDRCRFEADFTSNILGFRCLA